MSSPMIVGFGGTTRPGSTGERLIAAVLSRTEQLGARTRMFGGAALFDLPHFDPERPERTEAQREFLETVRAADGLVIGTPSYHGGVSGMVKNAIDLLEDTREDGRPYFDGLPVGIIVGAAGWQAGGITLAAMRGTVHAMRGWPTPLGIVINTVAQKVFDPSGAVIDEGVRQMIDVQADQIMRLAGGKA